MAKDARATLTWLLLLVATLVLPFARVWLCGESLMAALGGPGITRHGPVGQTPGVSAPYADGVAAFIDEPLAALRHDCKARGESDAWNPHNALGVPLYGNWQTSIDNPLRFLVQRWPHDAWSYDLTYVLRLLVAGTGAFVLALRLGLSAPGAFAAGATFGLSGYFVSYLPMHHLNGEVFLPWLWCTTDLLLAARARLWPLFAHCAASYCAVVAGNPQPALVTALTTVVFALGRGARHGWKGLPWFALGSLPAVLLAAPYWLAGLEYVAQSVHNHDATYGRDAFTLAGGLGLLVPDPFVVAEGRPLRALFAPLLGFCPLVLALLGAGRRPLRGLVLWGILIVLLGKLLNAAWLAWIGDLPGLATTKLFKYAFPPVTLALALLAGNGVEALSGAPLPRVRVIVALSMALGFLVALCDAGLSAAARLASDGVEGRIAGPAVFHGALGVALGLVARGFSAVPRPFLAAGLVALELVLAIPPHFLPRTQPFAPPAYLKAFTQRAGTFRVLPALGMLMPNQNAVFGVDCLTLHDALAPERYYRLIRYVVNPNVRGWPWFTNEDLGNFPPAQIRAFVRAGNELLPQRIAQGLGPSTLIDLTDPVRASVLDLCNVRYLLLPGEDVVAAQVAGWPTERYAPVYRDADAIVVERKSALPRAFFPKRCEAVAGPDAALQALRSPAWAPGELGLLEIGAGREPLGAQPAAAEAFVEERKSASEVRIRAQADAPAWMIVAQLLYPGWKAEIDGKPAPLVPADLVATGLLVPKGRCTVRLWYEPTWATLGHWLVALGAVLLAGLAVVAVRSRPEGRGP